MKDWAKTMKSGLIAAFFMAISAWAHGADPAGSGIQPVHPDIVRKIQGQGLDQHPVWHALLHLNKGQTQIQSPGFLLSNGGFSPFNEMVATLTYLYGTESGAVCRFPARYLWLQAALDLPELAITACPDILEFIDKAPFDELALVYATDSHTQASSMMGHTFLKLSGENHAGQMRAHAVSYYTDANSINLPKELWQSLVSGKKGIFSLTPYNREVEKYVDQEQRNLWEYTIRTTPMQRELIRNHLFELKQIELTYFLHAYNCATVLANILRLTENLPEPGPLWTTPQDVVRQAQQANMVVATTVRVADPWIYRHLLPAQTASFQREAMNFLTTEENRPALKTHPRQHPFLSALNGVLHKTQKISDARWAENERRLQALNAPMSTATVHLPNELNPALAVGDSRLALSWVSRPAGISTLLHWVPASHLLTDKPQNPQAETEFQLFSGALEITADHQLKLHRLHILSTRSLQPWDPLLKPLSRKTRIGYGAWSQHPADPKHMHMQSAWGITQRWWPQLDVSWLGGAALQLRPGASSLLATSEISAVFRTSDRAKTWLSWHHWHGRRDHMRQLKAQQTLYPKPDLTFWVDMEVTVQQDMRRHTVGIGIQKSF